MIPFINSSFFRCCFPFAVFEHSRVRDFKFLNLFSLSSKFFFARANSSETHATRTTARARFKNRKHAPRTRRKSSAFSLCTRARTLAHARTHARSLRRGRESSKKRKISVFASKLSHCPGRKSLKKDVLASVQTKRVQDRSGETKVGATETTKRNREEEIG